MLATRDAARDDVGRRCCADALDHAYGAGRGRRRARRPSRRATISRARPPTPSSRRCASASTVAIDSGEEGDTGGLVERIGARYPRVEEPVARARRSAKCSRSAWTRGVYDAVPDEAVLWWIPFEEGRCSDCDDNALEPTVKGKQFPTGQALPPAHPGCKCLLAPAGMLAGA